MISLNTPKAETFPSVHKTSRLSPYLHFGEISPKQILSACIDQLSNNEYAAFIRELVWREFSFYLLYHYPDMATNNIKPSFNSFPWQQNKKLLTAWQRGLTGYPIIDAGMRELWQTGYMHNRVRMIVASFLIKNLLIDWREGEAWFWDCLFDADWANNSASWQWVAGSGMDAAPFFRIFNPILQSKKFDADAIYIKKYIPELSNLDTKYIHDPSSAPEHVLKQAGIELDKQYPKAIVDLKATRERALTAYKQLPKL